MLNTSLNSKLLSVGSLQKETACSSVNMLFVTSIHHHSERFSWYSKLPLLEKKPNKALNVMARSFSCAEEILNKQNSTEWLSMKEITVRSQFLKTLCLSMEKLLFTATLKLSSRKTHLSSWFDTAP